MSEPPADERGWAIKKFLLTAICLLFAVATWLADAPAEDMAAIWGLRCLFTFIAAALLFSYLPSRAPVESQETKEKNSFSVQDIMTPEAARAEVTQRLQRLADSIQPEHLEIFSLSDATDTRQRENAFQVLRSAIRQAQTHPENASEVLDSLTIKQAGVIRGSFASRPSLVPIGWKRLFHRDFLYRALIVLTVMSIVLPPLALLLYWLSRKYFGLVEEKCMHGMLLPGILLDPEQKTAAVIADLSTGGGAEYPALRIGYVDFVEEDFPGLRSGMRIVVSTFFGGETSREHWDRFVFTLLDGLADNPAALLYAYLRVEDSEWEEINTALARLDSLDIEKQYPLWTEEPA